MVAMLNSISMKAKLVVEGYIIGQHRSPYHGFSVEFSEHRSYEPGDEVKHIDWKLYGKTNRLYVKRYEEETNLRAHLILDTSKSMSYTSNKVSKLDYGSYLLAALSYLMISQQDAAGVVLFDEKIRSFIPPKSTPSHLNTLLNVLDTPKPGNDTKIESVLHQMAERINKRGLVIIISDLLDEPKSVLKGLKHFRHRKQEVILFHILDRNELEFEFENRTKFVDMESGEEITTDPWHIKNDYKNLILDVQKYYKRNCRLNKIDYVSLYTDDSLEKGLSEYFNKRQRLG
ncbi:DUF58 domain-containing protein [Candidatus Marinimicrobia bacterium]|nr:DUF58 domain-containing protein [Candidatus Neomarinimicrobiota bacterium]